METHSHDHYYRQEDEILQEKILARDQGIVEIDYNEKVSPKRVPAENQRFAQPLPSPLSSPSKQPGNSMPSSARKSPSRGSSTSSEENIGTRAVTVSVLRDTGSKVEIVLKAHGLKKKKGLLNSFVTVFKKPNQPSRLLSNGKFTEFTLKENSLRFSLDVVTDKKKKKGNGNRVDTFVCEVKRFPTEVNPDSAEFEVLEPASGEAFILLTLIKLGNLSVNWKEFLDQNGTIDVTCI
ncbi:unnamed protein product [Caenorhabditis angaria]|uniref:Uncharacterized protein n=1 Tax=Caenorhabditis angaria TaxID=860376 RepID=A0A9P1ISQ9_9PELO|nr:unnamed protein product [Caenorhabditis angaria]